MQTPSLIAQGKQFHEPAEYQKPFVIVEKFTKIRRMSQLHVIVLANCNRKRYVKSLPKSEIKGATYN